MKLRTYLSNIAPGWSPERQEAVLDAKLPDWRNGAVYRDTDLTVRERRAHQSDTLIGRASALRSTSRNKPQTLHVAALPVIAWGKDDFRQVLAMMDRGNYILIAVDTGTRIEPWVSGEAEEAAIQEFSTRRRIGSEEASRRQGAIVSAVNRRARAQAAADKIESRWELPTDQFPTVELLREAGISLNTAKQYLGSRPKAQRLYRAKLKRDAARAAKEKGE